MRLESEFTAKNNKLYTIDGKLVPLDVLLRTEAAMICGRELEPGARKKMINELAASNDRPLCVYLPWFLVEISPETYNEALLASLHDFFREIEADALRVVIIPQPDADSSPVPLIHYGKLVPESARLFTAAMKHTARRLKDCRSVIGFAIPKELLLDGLDAESPAGIYMSELAEKHDQYVFFAKKRDIDETGNMEKITDTSIVLY
jgi:hypothetical protein